MAKKKAGGKSKSKTPPQAATPPPPPPPPPQPVPQPKPKKKAPPPEDPFEKLLRRLPRQTRKTLEGSATEAGGAGRSAYRSFLERVPADVRTQAMMLAGKEPIPTPTLEAPGVCLCEFPDGDWPKMLLFKDLAGLLGRLKNLEGDEYTVWPFIGVPMRFSKPDAHGHRYLFLPGEEEALRFDDPTTKVPVKLLDHVEFQEDCWLGHPSLAEPVLGTYLRPGGDPPPSKKKPVDTVDDDDDEENQLGDGVPNDPSE